MQKEKLSYGEISALCLELSLFLHAGADPAGGLVLLAEEAEEPWLRQAFEDMARHMDEGGPLSEAMDASGLFPREVYAMVQVGERTGRTEEALRSLAEYYDHRDVADRQIRSALLYPSILFLVMLAVIVVLLTQVLPVFSDVYASLGGQMTGIAGGLLQLGLVLDAILPLLCVILGLAAAALTVFSCLQSVRERLTDLWRKRRGDRGVFRQMSTARFAQALSMGLSSGLTPGEAVETAVALLEDQPDAAKRCRDCLDRIAENESFADALRASRLLPAAECRLLALGLASGSGEAAAEEIARRLQRDADDALQRRISQVEPAMVVITSVLVGAILLTVMLPLTRIMTAIG